MIACGLFGSVTVRLSSNVVYAQKLVDHLNGALCSANVFSLHLNAKNRHFNLPAAQHATAVRSRYKLARWSLVAILVSILSWKAGFWNQQLIALKKFQGHFPVAPSLPGFCPIFYA